MKLFQKEVYQLLYGETAKKQRTGNAYGNLVSLVLGAAILLLAYWIVLKHFMTAGGFMLFVAVVLGMIGTILFIRGLARLLSILASSVKHKATSGLYVFTLRQIHENVVHKYVSISVASILMMLTIMLIADGSASIMSSQMTRGASVYDFTVTGDAQLIEQYLSSEKMLPYVSALNHMEAGTMKRPASGDTKSFVDWSEFREQLVQHLPEDVIDPATQGAVSYEFGSNQPAALNLLGYIDTGSSSPYLIPVSSYNRLLEAAGEACITLGMDEAVYYLNPDFSGKTSSLC